MLDDIINSISNLEDIILFLDYDGTLAPICSTPGLALLHLNQKKILRELSCYYKTVIVTGRSLKDIRKLLGINSLGYIGNHGLEIQMVGKTWLHPNALKQKQYINKILQDVELKSRHIKGVFVEKKQYSGSVHYRLVDSESRKVLFEIVSRVKSQFGEHIIITRGKEVFEIRPKYGCNKGQGIEQYLSLMKIPESTTRIFIGDDETDEDGFKFVCEPHLSICVGEKHFTNARYKIKDVDGVWKIIRYLHANRELFHKN